MIAKTNNNDENSQEINPMLLRFITLKLKKLSIEMADMIKTRVSKDNFLDQLSFDFEVWFDFLTSSVYYEFFEVEEFLYENSDELTGQEKEYAVKHFKNEVEQLVRKNIKLVFTYM